MKCIPPIIIKHLEHRSGIMISEVTDKELSVFLHIVNTETGCSLGLNTLKRMLGKISDCVNKPRVSSLNVLALYLGYSSWSDLLLSIHRGDSSFDAIEGEIRSVDLPVSASIELSYLPDRHLQFIKVDDDLFEVTLSVNSKLLPGDLCHITSFISHYPLIISQVIRSDHSLGSYTAARVGGISEVKVIDF